MSKHFPRKFLFTLNLIFLNVSVVAILAVAFYNIYFQALTNPAESTSAALVKNAPDEVLCRQILEKVNYARLEAGLDPLRESDLLVSAAYQKIDDVNQYKYFSHTNPQTQKRWSDFIRESGYEYSEIGENLAIGYSTPEEVVEAWLDSPTHKKNLLSEKFSESGMAYATITYENQETSVLVHFMGG